jgi:ketosteroid isomerase-like protein
MRTIMPSITVGILFAAVFAPCQTAQISPRNAINAGNQAWIDGVKAGDVKRIAATYAEDAVNCRTTGECIRGRIQIEQEMTAQLASLGRAHSAAVKTWGSTEQGSFVYEWGQAEATFDGGKELVERYLTVWRKQPDGAWKIFRNMVIPAK